MVRHRVRSLPGSVSSQHELGCNGRSKSLVSLNWNTSSPSTAGSASSLSLNEGGDLPEFTSDNNVEKASRERSRSSSSNSTGNRSQANEAAADQVSLGTDAQEKDSTERPGDLMAEPELAETEKSEPEPVREEGDDEVFRDCSEEAPNNGESTQLSVIDEEKDEAEGAHLENLDEESDDMSKLSLEAVAVSFKEEDDDDNDEEETISAGDFSIPTRQRPSAPALLMHTRGQSMSSLEIRIPPSYSQPETLSAVGDSGASTVSTAQTSAATQSSKLPVRRGLSSSFLTNRDPDATNRPVSQNFDALEEGTVLVALSSSSSSVASKGLDRSLSASTPSIDSAVNELVRGNGRERDSTASRKPSKHSRAPSIAVPAITPRIPLMALLPAKVSKPVERTGDGTKTKERSSGFFGTRKRAKANESRPHFWIKNSCSNSACCDVCNKPLANTDAYQCNDCLSSVHASCKASLDKSSCVKMKHPKPGKSQPGPLRPTVLETTAGPNGSKQKDSDSPSPFNETLRSQSVKGQRHSVVGMFPADISQAAHSMTAPAGLNSLQPSFRTYANGFRSYIDMDEEWKALGIWDEFPDAWSTGPGKSEKKKLSAKEVKRQDNFHEMFITELHHCQTLTVLKYTYFIGLVTNGIIPFERLNQLLPCLDELIEIHYRFFQALKKKRDGALVVNSVHDVLMEQFSNETASKMVKAYTRFCYQKDATVREYHRLVSSSAEVSNFIKTVTAGSFYKSRSLPDCLLLVTQRLSKYHSFVENLRKNTADDSPEKEGILVAERAVKELIAAVDSGIEKAQMQQARQEICNSMDPKASTELSVQDVSQGKTTEWKEIFKVDDLRNPERTLLYYGDVFWQNARQKPAEITLLLFSDIIVFLQKNGSGGYNFFRQDQKNGVIRLHKLIVRDKAGRLGSQGIYLIAVSPKPDMYDISCKSKKELAVWMDRIQRAVQACSSKSASENRQTHSLLTGKEEEELRVFFDRLDKTNVYMRAIHDERLGIYSEMFDYVAKLPLRSNEDKDKIASLINEHRSSSSELVGQENVGSMWQAVQERYGSAIAEAAESQEQEDKPSEETEENAAASSSSGAELGRSKTFHFVANSGRRPRLRKHPTVSGIPEMEERIGKRYIGPQVLDELSHADGRPVSEATSYLLSCWADVQMLVEELRQDKLRLTAELALAKERSRQTAGALACDSGLENLRRLSTELEARRKQFYQETSDKDIELKFREKALKEKEEKIAKEEEEIQNRWARLTAAWENQRLHGLPLPSLVSSPSSGSNYAVETAIPVFTPGTPTDTIVTDSPPPPPAVVVQRATSFRPMDMAVPPQLAGAVTNASRAEIRQQLPTNLSKDNVFDLSKKWRASSKEKSGSKKYFGSSKSPDRQMIPNKLAINKK